MTIANVGPWIAAGLGSMVAGWALRTILPHMLLGKLEDGLFRLQTSSLLDDPAHPKRLAWYRATLEMLDAEMPPKGDPKEAEFYLKVSQEVLALIPSASALMSAQAMATVLQANGETLNQAIDEELARLKTP